MANTPFYIPAVVQMGTERLDLPYAGTLASGGPPLKVFQPTILVPDLSLQALAVDLETGEDATYLVQEIEVVDGQTPTGLYKIGKSNDPDRRLGNLQTGNPNPIKVIGVAPGGTDFEGRLHGVYAHQRVRGEWFRFTLEELEEVKLRFWRQRYGHILAPPPPVPVPAQSWFPPGAFVPYRPAPGISYMTGPLPPPIPYTFGQPPAPPVAASSTTPPPIPHVFGQSFLSTPDVKESAIRIIHQWLQQNYNLTEHPVSNEDLSFFWQLYAKFQVYLKEQGLPEHYALYLQEAISFAHPRSEVKAVWQGSFLSSESGLLRTNWTPRPTPWV